MSMMPVSMCFHIHQPYRVKKYRVFDVGHDGNYFNDANGGAYDNRHRLIGASRFFYTPATERLLALLKHRPQLMVGFAFSGTALEQLESWAPDTLALFKAAVDTGQVQLSSTSYYHSHAFRFSPEEYDHHIHKHAELVWRLFGMHPRGFHFGDNAPIDHVQWAQENDYHRMVELPDEDCAEELAAIARKYDEAHTHKVALLREKNALQTAALDALYALEPHVATTSNSQLKESWRRLQSADHFHAMATPTTSTGTNATTAQSEAQSPYDSYMSYMYALKDLEGRLSLNRDS